MTDLGTLNYFLGIFVSCDNIWMFLSQRKYALELLQRAHTSICNSSRTPIETESKLAPMVILLPALLFIVVLEVVYSILHLHDHIFLMMSASMFIHA